MVRSVLDSARRGAEAAENNSQGNVEEDRWISKETSRRLLGVAAPRHAQSRTASCIYPSERLGGGLQFVEVVMGWPCFPPTSCFLGLLRDFLARCRVVGSSKRDEQQADAPISKEKDEIGRFFAPVLQERRKCRMARTGCGQVAMDGAGCRLFQVVLLQCNGAGLNVLPS